MLFAVTLPPAEQRRIQQAQRAIVTNASLGDLFARLAAGGRDTVAIAPAIDFLGQLLGGAQEFHVSRMPLNSVTVKP